MAAPFCLGTSGPADQGVSSHGSANTGSVDVGSSTHDDQSVARSIRSFFIESIHQPKRASSQSSLEQGTHAGMEQPLATAKSVPLHLLAIPDLPSLLRMPIEGGSTCPPVSAAARWRKGKLAMNVNTVMAGLGAGRNGKTGAGNSLGQPRQRKKRKVIYCVSHAGTRLGNQASTVHSVSLHIGSKHLSATSK